LHLVVVFFFFRGFHEQVLNIDLLSMLMIDDEFSFVDKEVFNLDQEHGGGSVWVLLPKWKILAWGPFEMAGVLQFQLKY
jgi:hypothetical protein